MINISWSQFEINQQAKDISFESFCHQIAYTLYKDFGLFENYYNTPGSEFYTTLHTDCVELNLKIGDEIGWQVKWWYSSEENSSLNADHKQKLIENFKTTLNAHPKIKRWIICTPGAFVEKEFAKLKVDLKKLSPKTEIEHWNKNTFNNFRKANFEKLGPLYNHYFNSNFIGFDFLKTYSERRVDDLKKKFDTDLYTPSHYDKEILFMLDYKQIFHELEVKTNYLQDDIREIESDKSYTKNDYKSFDSEYIIQAYELLKLCVKTSRQAIDLVSSKLTITKSKQLYSLLQNHILQHRKLADFLNRKMKSNEHVIDGDFQEKHIEHWIHKEYLIASINKIQGHLIVAREGEENNEKTFLDIVELIFQKDLHILSSAGFGKTNIACNICLSCINKGIPCLLILGSTFRKSELPQRIILEQLELSLKYEFRSFLKGLDTLGFIKGVKVPIIIDGLNESTPYDMIWRTNIKDIIREIEQLENVILITTCRDRYIEAIFEEADISHIRHTKTLVGLSGKVRDNAIAKYFTKYNIVPSSWSFNKDLFKNPLLLRIFSEVNENKRSIHISLNNVFKSINKYTEKIIDRASQQNSKVDPIVKQRIKSRIENFSKSLWESNRREMSLVEFHEIIHPESESLDASLTAKLLDEGLCFQKNLSLGGETVQFTYDLVGGYTIAASVLLKSIQHADEIDKTLNKFEAQKKLFTKETEHPLRQDILISLIHLVPEKLEVNLFELFDNEVVIEECFNSIDYFIDNIEGQRKLLEKISKESKDSRNFKLLFEKLFENTFKKEIAGLGNFTIDTLLRLNQGEIDIFWSELIRKGSSVVYQILFQVKKSYTRNKFAERNAEQDLLVSFLSTTSSDKSIRNLATENLFLIGKKHPFKLLQLLKQTLSFRDFNSIESLTCALCGTVLCIKEKQFTIDCLGFIENEFMPNHKTTHICIQDFIQTILEFAESFFKIKYKGRLTFNKNNFKVVKDTPSGELSKGNMSTHFPDLLGIDLYDFNKYQISSIATDRYEKRVTYTERECLMILINVILDKGYDEKFFQSVTKDLQDDTKYKFGRGRADNLTVYPEKYLWQSYYEFVGYLFLCNKIKSEDVNRYRCDYNYFDPTFPRLPQKFQIVTNCFFPSENESIQKWINSNRQNFIDDFYIHTLRTNSEWIMLSADITQEGAENSTRFHLSVNSYLIPENNISQFKNEAYKGSLYSNSTSFYNIYAGEISWSKFLKNNEPGYYEEKLEMIPTVCDYTWTGWTTNRFQNPYFKFLNPKLSNLLKLIFDPDELSFYDKKGNQISKIVWIENAKFYYIKRQALESIISKLNLELVWFQFVTKYGEFGKHEKKELNPSYKDLKKIFLYSSLINK